MDNWRPDGWGNPYDFMNGVAIPYYETQSRCYEEGADAMLGALMKMPVQVQWLGDGKGGIVFNISPAPIIDEWRGYTLVFIPDEED